MGNLLIASCIVVWFPPVFLIATTPTRRPTPAMDWPWVGPLILSSTFAFAQFVFNVQREDGTAVLEQGLSASNIMTIAITLATAVYLLGVLCIRREVALLPFSAAYRPYTLMITYGLLSVAWSVVPTYTLYRSFELIVFYLLALILFDRADVRRKLGRILAFYVLAWLFVSIPRILESLT
ncbi:MAG: hypothetical protein ACRYGP_02140, partial [Janthinobacterium lividum]